MTHCRKTPTLADRFPAPWLRRRPAPGRERRGADLLGAGQQRVPRQAGACGQQHVPATSMLHCCHRKLKRCPGTLGYSTRGHRRRQLMHKCSDFVGKHCCTGTTAPSPGAVKFGWRLSVLLPFCGADLPGHCGGAAAVGAGQRRPVPAPPAPHTARVVERHAQLPRQVHVKQAAAERPLPLYRGVVGRAVRELRRWGG